MDWKIDYLEDGNIVHVKMLGPISLEDAKQLCTEGSSVAREHQSSRYLVDHQGVDIILSVSDINKMPEEFRKAGADFSAKTAILLDSSAPGVDRFHLLKSAFARAWKHYALFSDKDEAIAWLKSS
jgi:hypothetical protein